MTGPINCFSNQLLQGKLALVTGGGTGIGKAIACELARVGADLVLAARRQETLDETAAAMRDETGREVSTLARIGCARGTVAGILATELALLLAGALVLALGLATLIRAFVSL